MPPKRKEKKKNLEDKVIASSSKVAGKNQEDQERDEFEEEESFDEENEGQAWPKTDDRELLKRIKLILPQNDEMKYDTRVKHLNWNLIKFQDYSSGQRKIRWMHIQSHLRHYLTLSEVIEEAASWVDGPFYNFNKGGKGKSERIPKSGYFLFKKRLISSNALQHFKNKKEKRDEIAKRWREVTVEEKISLNNEVLEMNYNTFLYTLSPEQLNSKLKNLTMEFDKNVKDGQPTEPRVGTGVSSSTEEESDEDGLEIPQTVQKQNSSRKMFCNTNMDKNSVTSTVKPTSATLVTEPIKPPASLTVFYALTHHSHLVNPTFEEIGNLWEQVSKSQKKKIRKEHKKKMEKYAMELKTFRELYQAELSSV
jgi:hypothetical protein